MKRKVSCGSRRAETWNHNEMSILCNALKWGSSKVFSALIFTCACLKCFPRTAAGKYSPANTIIRLSGLLLIAILLTQLVRMFRVSWYSTANKGIQAFVSELLTDSTIAKTLLTFNCALCLAHLGHSWQEAKQRTGRRQLPYVAWLEMKARMSERGMFTSWRDCGNWQRQNKLSSLWHFHLST